MKRPEIKGAAGSGPYQIRRDTPSGPGNLVRTLLAAATNHKLARLVAGTATASANFAVSVNCRPP